MKRIRLISSVLVYVFSFAMVYAQDRTRIPSEKPKLIIGITIDQMRYDYLQRFWSDFEAGGFKRLMNEGTICRDTRINYTFTRSAVGHASISTGAYPSGHGIISDEWYINLEDRVVNCTEDKNQKTIGGSFEAGLHSPKRLMTTTFADELKLSNNKKSKTFGISFEPHQAIISAGHTADGAYWFDKTNGNWVSSSFYIDSLPVWVREFNEKRFPDTYLEQIWEPLYPLENYDESLQFNDKYESGLNNKKAFPYELEKLQKKYDSQNKYELLEIVPFGNNYTKDFAIATIVNEQLGADVYTDFLSVSFSSNAAISKRFGPTSIELQDTYLRLDKDLAHFLSFVDETIGKENVLIYLTSPNGVSHIPEYLLDSKIPGGYFNAYAAISLLKSYLNVVYGEGEWVTFYHANQIYLDRQLIEDSKYSLEDVQTRIAQFMIQFEGIANTVTATTLHTRNFTRGILEKIQNSYNQKHSGDVILTLKPGWVEKSEYTTGNNSAYTYDAHVPLIWYGWKIGRQKIYRETEIIDIASTIATFLNISYPGANIGNPILEMIVTP